MGHTIFTSFDKPKPARATVEDMAYNLAMEQIELYKAIRAEAEAREKACEPSLPWTPQAQECIDTLEALMKGRHGPMVKMLVLEHFPELITIGKLGGKDGQENR